MKSQSWNSSITYYLDALTCWQPSTSSCSSSEAVWLNYSNVRLCQYAALGKCHITCLMCLITITFIHSRAFAPSLHVLDILLVWTDCVSDICPQQQARKSLSHINICTVLTHYPDYFYFHLK